MKKVNYKDPVERNFHGIKEELVAFMSENNMDLYYDEENGNYTFYDKDGNDVEVVTFKELQTMVEV